MTNSIRILDFKNKYYLLERMPVYIKTDFTKQITFLFLCEILLIVVTVCFGDLSKEKDFLMDGLVFITIVTLVLISFFLIGRKTGSFVLSADENGVYYKIFNMDDKFVLLEWRAINRIGLSSDENGATLIDVLSIIRTDEAPTPCNATRSKTSKTKSLKISFILPNSVSGSEVKSKLDRLRVNSHKATLA